MVVTGSTTREPERHAPVAAPAARNASAVVWLAAAGLTAGLVLFSQTLAWYPDERIHLLGAFLVSTGRRPYRDFFYQHAPLFLYAYAGWMGLVGRSWRTAHLFSALLSGGCIVLVTGFVLARVPDRVRLPIGLAAALFMGLNVQLADYGGVGYPLALSLFLSVAGFCAAVATAKRLRASLALAAGALAGGAASASLLAAPVGPLLFYWLLRQSPASVRRRIAWPFLAGVLIGLSPFVVSVAQAPRQAFADVVQFHLFHRLTSYPPAMALFLHDAQVLVRWIYSTQVLILLLLAIAGLVSVRHRFTWNPHRLPELRLCTTIAVVMSLYLMLGRPTLHPYYLMVVPFLVVLAAFGLCELAVGATSRRTAWLVVIAAILYGADLPRWIYANRSQLRHPLWTDAERVAREMNRVVPRDVLVYADESVYFSAGRIPPPGFENYSTDVFRFKVDEWLASDRFGAILIDAADPRIEALRLRTRYARSEALNGGEWADPMILFWDKIGSSTR